MKKTLSVLGCAVLVCIAVLSCKKESLSEKSSDAVVNHGSISVETEMTKVGLGGESNLSIVWKAGDKIGLFSSDGVLSNTVAELVEGVGTASGRFDFAYEGELAPDTDIYAYYPYNGTTSPKLEGNKLSNLVLPCAQRYESREQAVAGCILVGMKGTDGKIVFKNSTAIAEVALTGSDPLSQVSLMAMDESLTGYGEVTISTTTNPVFKISNNKLSDGKSTGAAYATGYTGSSKTSGAPLTTLSNTPYYVYFVIPANNYMEEDLCLEAVTESYSMAKIARNDHNFKRNHIVPFATINVAKPEYPGVKDLCKNESGKTEYSNCFVVRPSDQDANYCFKAVAADGTLRYGNTDPEKDAPGASARLVWETSYGLVTNVNMDWTNKTINFTVPGNNTKGSAVICIVNQYNNSIYWTWHIWISDVKDQSWGNSPVFMDRNLGAEWTPKTFDEVEGLDAETALTTSGLLYQYGNSYPFPRANSITPEYGGKSNNQELTAFGEQTQEVVIYRYGKWTQGFFSTGRALSASTFKMDDFRWYPMTLNYNNANDTDGAYGCAWASNVDPYGDGAEYSWGRGVKKARRDPCPVGYKVPSDAEFVWFRRPNNGSKSDGNAFYWQYMLDKGVSGCTGNGTYVNMGYKTYGAYQTTEWVRDANNRGNGEVIWFPKQGVRLGKGFGNAGALERVGYWYADGSYKTGSSVYWCIAPAAASTIEGTATVQSGKGSSTSTGEAWISANGNLYQWGFLATSSAACVRCVKIAGANEGGVDAGGLEDGGNDDNPWVK